MLPQMRVQQSIQPPASALHQMQLLSSAQRSMQSQISTECKIQSLTKAGHNVQSSVLYQSSQSNIESVPADVTVMFQPPYAVQDIVDTKLKCAMLTIIDRICGNSSLHNSCTAFHHYCKEQPTVIVAHPQPVTTPIWAPQSSGSLSTYLWTLPDKVDELNEQSKSQMRNLWSDQVSSVDMQLSSISCEDISSVIPFSSAGTEITQSCESIVVPENMQSVIVTGGQSDKLEGEQIAPVEMESELDMQLEDKKLTVLPEWQEIQQQKLQARREKRTLKKRKRRQEKRKQKQQQQLQDLHQNQHDENEDQLLKV